MPEHQPERSKDKIEESVSIEELPMSSFKELTRRLLKVRRDELAEQERLYLAKKQEEIDV